MTMTGNQAGHGNEREVITMGWGKPKVPNTVSDKKRAELNRRAQKESMFSKKAVDRRKASEVQRKKSIWS